MERECGNSGKKSVRVQLSGLLSDFYAWKHRIFFSMHENFALEIQPEKQVKSLHQLQFVCPQHSQCIVGISSDKVTQGSLNQWIGLDGCQCGSKNICPKFFITPNTTNTQPNCFPKGLFPSIEKQPAPQSCLNSVIAWAKLIFYIK